MREEQKTFSIIKLLPNMVTITALCLSISSLRLAIDGQFSEAFMFVVIACFLDGIDGRVAKMLHASSDFGAQMDSLADFLDFGIAPGLLVYFWKMKDFPIRGVAWLAVLLLAVCMAIRLARFNVGLMFKDQSDPLVKYFFEGIPAPSVAGMIMLPAIWTIQFGPGFYSTPMYVVINTIIMSLLAASTVPTPAITKLPIKHSYKNLMLIILALFVVGMLIKPWLVLSLMGIWYVCVVIIGLFAYMRLEKKSKGKKK